ncbi:MAG: ATP-dependent sacrificial sulfur transferase LarE [Phycisphaerae bacterium]|nr:ATP-dependent sacrificial sulfur transferase LarE [Phycisphaerae bacterium]
MNPENLPENLRSKYTRCREILRSLGSVVVGLSGGVDSSLLLGLAVDTLGSQKTLAATATGLMHPECDTAAARQIAESLGAQLVEIDVSDLADSNILDNPPDRCYWCKRFIFRELQQLAVRRGLAVVVSGSNADDSSEYRPGSRAEAELGISRPLLEANMTKQDVRDLARAMGLATWDKPSHPCLATRVPYHRKLTGELLRRIEQAEQTLIDMGFSQCRLRDHDTIARIEVSPAQFRRAIDMREEIVAALQELGYNYITLDLQGFRSGAMDELLE